MTKSPRHPVPKMAHPAPPDVPRSQDAPGRVSAPERGPTAVLGALPAFHYRQAVDQTLIPNDFPRLTSLVRTLAPDAGSVRELGDGLLWEQNSRFTALALTINPEPPGTVIRADLRLEGRQFAYYLGAVSAAVLTGLTATTALPPSSSLAVGVGSLIPFGLMARALWNRSARRSVRQLRALVDQIAAALRGELE
jgi:hypothetical protein